MSFSRVLFPVIFLMVFLFPEVNAEVLKTINVSMPTNYGTFLGEIHYAEKDLVTALKVERIIKEDLIKVINYFEYVPHDVVHFNLDPYLRITNGNARPFPTNIINLYNFPANNKEHLIVMDNWMQGLVLHEFVHIVHLDQTRDYLKVGRSIFGTIAKLPAGIVPRWFTEGIAVWGESHLMNGGRLQNPLFNKELLIQFKKHDFCQSIDCIDEPGMYPHGQLAYWAGAHFIEWLEEKRPKTIKCLVEQNSAAIPFFLNNAFQFCTNEKAQDLFKNFREDFITKESGGHDEAQWGTKISNAHGSDDYQKGFVLDGDRLFKVELAKYREALVAYDLKDDVNFIQKYEFPISDLGGMVEVDKDNKMLLVSFNDDPRYRKHNKVWKLINPDTLLVERTLDFADDPSYVVSLGGDSYITFSYLNNSWMVERNGEVLKNFSANDNITLVKKIGDQILLKINDSYGNNSLVLADLDFKKMSVIYKSTAVYDLPIISEKLFIIREGKELKLVELNAGKIQISSLPADRLNQITFAEFNEGRVIALENRLMTVEKKAYEVMDYLMKGKSNTTTVTATDYVSVPAPKGSYASERAEDFPRWDHLIPHYWFLAAGNSDNLNSIGAMTSFSDPMDVYTLNATLLTYPSEKKVGGTLEYLQKLVRWSDLWYATAFFDQEYSKTDFSSHIDLSRDFFVKTLFTVLKGRWTYVPGLYAQRKTTNDFISDRATNSFGVSNNLMYKAQAYDDFFQYFTGDLNLQADKANIGEGYLNTYMDADIGGRFTEKFTASLRGTWGKLYKSDFARGVIYGGGLTDYTRKRQHEFYGLPYSNAYGNEIVTVRVMGDYEVWDVYRGKDLLPIFFKEIHLLFGRESMFASRIFIDNQLLKEKMINGLFVGPRIKMNLFYFVPANLDVIYSTIAKPDGSNSKTVDAVLTMELF